MKRIFKYIENLWLGADGKISLKAVLAIAFSIDFIRNFAYATTKWGEGKSLESLATPLMIEAGLIAALLGITAYTNVASHKIDTDAANPNTDSQVKIANVEQVTVQPSTKADTVNTNNVETVNAQQVNTNTRED